MAGGKGGRLRTAYQDQPRYPVRCFFYEKPPFSVWMDRQGSVPVLLSLVFSSLQIRQSISWRIYGTLLSFGFSET